MLSSWWHQECLAALSSLVVLVPRLQFKTTLLARRFPGLRDLKDEDIRNLITADSKAAGRALTDPRSNKTRPNTDYFIPAPKRDTIEPSTQAPFSPINPYMAKDEITRTAEEVSTDCTMPHSGQCAVRSTCSLHRTPGADGV